MKLYTSMGPNPRVVTIAIAELGADVPAAAASDSTSPAQAPALLGPASSAELGAAAPNFRLVDSNGQARELADFSGAPVVLEWVNLGCPFVKKHYGADNMQALQERFTGEGVAWLTICSSAPGKQGHLDAAGWNAAIAEQGMHSTAVLIDETGTVGRAYDARTTPNMYVVDAEGTLVYAGAIDDDPSPRASGIEGATNNVAEVLELLLSGNDVEPFETAPYGCGVKYAN